MKCSICGKPVILQPSAAERARRFGGTAKHYEECFPTHTDCLIAQRNRETSELIAKMKSPLVSLGPC